MKFQLHHASLSLKVAFSLFLGSMLFGLFLAEAYLVLRLSGSESKVPGVKKVQEHFFVKKHPLLRIAIDGSMKEYVETQEERQMLLDFMEKKAPKEMYEEEKFKEFLEYSCIDCHSPDGEASFADFTKFENLKEVAIFTYRPYLKKRLRIAHPHMLAIPLLLLPIVLALAFTPLTEKWKLVWMSLPLIGVLLDISFWFVTMVYPWGAYFIMLGGAMTIGGALCAIGLNLYYLWFYKGAKLE